MSSKARLLLLMPAADSILIVGLFIYAGSGAEWDSWSVGLLAYNLLSPGALAALVVLTAGLWPRGMPVTAVTCLLFSGLLVAALLDMGSTSTGALLLLVLPPWFCVALFPFAVVGALVHGHRERKARPRRGSERTSTDLMPPAPGEPVAGTDRPDTTAQQDSPRGRTGITDRTDPMPGQ